jgi:RNA polymerase-binding transcription factor DksA
VTDPAGGWGTLTGMDVEHARQLIVSEKERLEGLVREREAEGIGAESETDSISELSSVDQHQGDIGTETFEREKDFSLLEQLEAEIGDLDAALRKIDDGTYGICEVCGKEIEPERLEAVPGTRTCIEHAGAR